MFVKIVGTVMHAISTVTELLLQIPFLGRIFDVILSFAATTMRLGAGGWVPYGLYPALEKDPMRLRVNESESGTPTIKLYEYEGCPFCRKVREALSELDLDFVCYPCPRETIKKYGHCEKSRFRPKVNELGGKMVFPYLVDENTGTKMYESGDIVKYLWATYGRNTTPSITTRLANAPVLNILNFFASAFRPLPRMGMLRTPSKTPKQPLVLWNLESSPFCRIAREALCTLELPYISRNAPHGSMRNRRKFAETHGSHLSKVRKAGGFAQLPFLEDPNTGVNMKESADIVAYLMRTYKTGETVKETMRDYTTDGATADHGKIQ